MFKALITTHKKLLVSIVRSVAMLVTIIFGAVVSPDLLAEKTEIFLIALAAITFGGDAMVSKVPNDPMPKKPS